MAQMSYSTAVKKNSNIENRHQQPLQLNMGQKSYESEFPTLDTVKSNYVQQEKTHFFGSQKNEKIWHKEKRSNFDVLKDQYEQSMPKDQEKAAIKNSSTLSLHIAAYENAFDMGDGNDFDTTGKKWKSIKQDVTYSSPFEIPRQQDATKKAAAITPEVMQFKASQKLLNPNQSAPSSQHYTRSKAAKAVATHEDQEESKKADAAATKKSEKKSGTSDKKAKAQPTSGNMPAKKDIKKAAKKCNDKTAPQVRSNDLTGARLPRISLTDQEDAGRISPLKKNKKKIIKRKSIGESYKIFKTFSSKKELMVIVKIDEDVYQSYHGSAGELLKDRVMCSDCNVRYSFVNNNIYDVLQGHSVNCSNKMTKKDMLKTSIENFFKTKAAGRKEAKAAILDELKETWIRVFDSDDWDLNSRRVKQNVSRAVDGKKRVDSETLEDVQGYLPFNEQAEEDIREIVNVTDAAGDLEEAGIEEVIQGIKELSLSGNDFDDVQISEGHDQSLEENGDDKEDGNEENFEKDAWNGGDDYDSVDGHGNGSETQGATLGTAYGADMNNIRLENVILQNIIDENADPAEVGEADTTPNGILGPLVVSSDDEDDEAAGRLLFENIATEPGHFSIFRKK